MEVLNLKNDQVVLTEMEAKVYNSLVEWSAMEDCFCNHPKEVSIITDIPMTQLRGVISSLVQKCVAYVDEHMEGCGEWVILYNK